MMSPKVLEAEGLIFWFHSYDALHEKRASVHVGKGSQNDHIMWIPSLYNASVEDREKFEISQSRTMIIWDPEKCGINDEISIVDYLGPTRGQNEGSLMFYKPREKEKKIADGKIRRKKKQS